MVITFIGLDEKCRMATSDDDSISLTAFRKHSESAQVSESMRKMEITMRPLPSQLWMIFILLLPPLTTFITSHHLLYQH